MGSDCVDDMDSGRGRRYLRAVAQENDEGMSGRLPTPDLDRRTPCHSYRRSCRFRDSLRDLADHRNPWRLAQELIPQRCVGTMLRRSSKSRKRTGHPSSGPARRGAISLLTGLVGVLLLSGCGTSRVQPKASIDNPPDSRAGDGSPGLASSFVYRVPSGSMEPTVRVGAKVNVTRGTAPTVGAIVVFHPPAGFAEQKCGPKPHVIKPGAAACDSSIPPQALIELIKRVVAGPGDEIYVRDGRVYRKAIGSHKFVRENDSYARPCGHAGECEFPVPIKIPAGHWFVMGDNRGESDDSRFWGPVPSSWIVGVAGAVVKARPIVEQNNPKGGETRSVAVARPSTASNTRAQHPQAHEHSRYAAFIACLRRNGVHVSADGTTGRGEARNESRVSARRCLKAVFGASSR
jgi:signal peptidase I